MFPGDRPLMSIQHKKIYKKVLWFIDTDEAVINVPGVPYLSH